MNRQKVARLVTTALILLSAANAFAAGSGMPWETPLNRFLDSITGPVTRGCGVLAIVLVGLGLAFSEGGGLMKKLLNIALGLSIAFSATTFFLDFFGYSSGLNF